MVFEVDWLVFVSVDFPAKLVFESFFVSVFVYIQRSGIHKNASDECGLEVWYFYANGVILLYMGEKMNKKD